MEDGHTSNFTYPQYIQNTIQFCQKHAQSAGHFLGEFYCRYDEEFVLFAAKCQNVNETNCPCTACYSFGLELDNDPVINAQGILHVNIPEIITVNCQALTRPPSEELKGRYRQVFGLLQSYAPPDFTFDFNSVISEGTLLTAEFTAQKHIYGIVLDRLSHTEKEDLLAKKRGLIIKHKDLLDSYPKFPLPQ